MSKVTIDIIKETIKDLPEDEKEIVMHLVEIFEGEEEKINNYIKDNLI